MAMVFNTSTTPGIDYFVFSSFKVDQQSRKRGHFTLQPSLPGCVVTHGHFDSPHLPKRPQFSSARTVVPTQ